MKFLRFLLNLNSVLEYFEYGEDSFDIKVRMDYERGLFKVSIIIFYRGLFLWLF